MQADSTRTPERRNVAGWFIGVVVILLGINALIGIASDPLDLKRFHRAAEELGGWNQEDLAVDRAGYSKGIFGVRSYVEFYVESEQPPKTVYIEINRPIYWPSWRLSEYRVDIAAAP